jgi:hypothetical protein
MMALYSMQAKRDTRAFDEEPILDRVSVVEWLEIQVLRSPHYQQASTPDAKVTITLPLYEWEHIVAAAKSGLHKGQGRGRPTDSRWQRNRKRKIAMWARGRKDQLIASGMKATGTNSAEDQAAEEARVLALDFGVYVAASTIKRMMQSDE